MNIVADEGVDRPIVVRLREQSYNVLYIAEMASGIGDEVLRQAIEHNALLLTADVREKLSVQDISFERVRLKNAFQAARSARFEHGESPKL